jgi:hypothetical protein
MWGGRQEEVLRGKTVVLATVPCPYLRAVAGRGAASCVDPLHQNIKGGKRIALLHF